MMQRVWPTMIVMLAAMPAPAVDPPRLVVRTIDRTRLAGELEAMSPDAGMVIRTGAGERVATPLGDLIEARAVDPARRADERIRAPSPAGWPRLFATGDGQRVVGTIAGADDEGVTIEHPWLGRLTFHRDRLAWIGPPGGKPTRSPVLQPCPQAAASSVAPDASDRILLVNADVIAGTIFALGVEDILLDVRPREVRVPWDKVDQVTFGAGRRPPAGRPAPSGSGQAEVILELADGSRLISGDVRYRPGDGDLLVLVHRGAKRRGLAVAADRVTRIGVRGGRWEWLSDRCPVEIAAESMLALDWPPLRDHNVLGGPLSMGGTVYGRGIGVHANCRLSYVLDGVYDRFVSRFGIDDDSGPWADVDVRVVVDGRTRFEAGHIRHADAPATVRVDLTGARRLDLIVTAGANGDVQDRFDWVDAGLVRGAGPPATRSASSPARER